MLPVEGGTEPLPAGEEGLAGGASVRSGPDARLLESCKDEEAEVYRGEWFLGGDLAIIDADGYIFHQGRANDVMKALGYRVSPLEVETAIAQHPDVAEVACAEISPREGVTVIGAFLVAKAGHTVDAGNVLAFAKERLAQYKCPREIIVVDALPRTPNGKVKRSELGRMFGSTSKA